MWKTRIDNRIAAASIGSVLLVSAVFMYMDFADYRSQSEKDSAQALLFQVPAVRPRHDYFKDIILGAQAAYVYDMTTKRVLYEKNATVPLPLASITKTMTAIVAEEANEAHGGNIVITIGPDALATEGESGLRDGEQWDLEKLLSFTLISSSNDGAEAIASGVGEGRSSFIATMNAKAKELGLSSLQFKNPSGLDIDGTNDTGGYGSARDIALLFEYGLKNHPNLFESTANTSKSFSSDMLSHAAKNTNVALPDIPNATASKTGYTLKAGGNLAMVFDRGLNEPVILVVLGSTYDGRFSDMESLASSTLKTYNQSQ